MTETKALVSALVNRGNGNEINDQQVEQLVDSVSRLVGGKDKAKDLIERYREATTTEAKQAVLSHLEPDVTEVLEQILHLEGPILKILAYINNTG